MRKLSLLVLALSLALFYSRTAEAHFGMLIPSKPTVMETKDADISLEIKFWHPFENKGMNLIKPESLKVFSGGQFTDLLSTIKEDKQQGFDTWTLPYKIKRPGLYSFLMEPKPYYEPEENSFIIHYTKVYVDAFGEDEGWNKPIPNLKTEIVPLAKPGGLYAGNIFTGRVMLDGQPIPDTEVEVEWYPGPDEIGQAPFETMVTQVVMTDDNGIFSYVAPKSGWWGFAALNSADFKLKENGEDKDVEIGAVLWLYFHDFNPSTKIAK